MLQTGSGNDERSEGSEDKSPNVSPVGNSRRLAEEAAVEDLHKQPQRKKPISWGFKANSKDKHVPKHFNLEFGKTHQEATHQRRHRPRGTKSWGDAFWIEQGVNERRNDSSK